MAVKILLVQRDVNGGLLSREGAGSVVAAGRWSC